jgi:hypothetical protein
MHATDTCSARDIDAANNCGASARECRRIGCRRDGGDTADKRALCGEREGCSKHNSKGRGDRHGQRWRERSVDHRSGAERSLLSSGGGNARIENQFFTKYNGGVTKLDGAAVSCCSGSVGAAAGVSPL